MGDLLRRLAACAGLALFGFAAGPALAGTVTTASAFVGSNGAVPTDGNLLYSGQTLFGATYGGGANDLGAIFALPAAGGVAAAAIHSFGGSDGKHPNGSLVADAAGNLYGTTADGGTDDLGTVFKLAKPASASGAWTLTLLHSFTGPDGAHPAAGVTLGADGALYGTAYEGGTVPCAGVLFYPAGCGTVFRLTIAGSFRLLHTFSGAQFDGAGPASNLVVDPSGVVIGTTSEATNSGDGGSLFAISPTSGFVNVTEFFPKALQGYPVGNIARDAAGNVYGMTALAGGLGSSVQGVGIFEVTAETHKQFLLKILTDQVSRSGVTRDGAGNLLGTVTGSRMDAGVHDGGLVFELSPNGTLTTLASLGFANAAPFGGVILDPSGTIWGTSSAGGQICGSSASPSAAGCGTVFTVKP